MTASKIEKYFVVLERNIDKQEELVEIVCFVNVTVNFTSLFFSFLVLQIGGRKINVSLVRSSYGNV